MLTSIGLTSRSVALLSNTLATPPGPSIDNEHATEFPDHLMEPEDVIVELDEDWEEDGNDGAEGVFRAALRDYLGLRCAYYMIFSYRS